MKTPDFGQVIKLILKNKYVLLVLLLGLVLILLPSGSSDKAETNTATNDLAAPSYSIDEEEKRLESILDLMDGAGEVKVLLSLKSSASRELAESKDEALVLSTGSGTESAVELWYDYPEYLGAVIICEGADNSLVRLNVTQAVASFTGLKSNMITVIKMK